MTVWLKPSGTLITASILRSFTACQPSSMIVFIIRRPPAENTNKDHLFERDRISTEASHAPLPTWLGAMMHGFVKSEPEKKIARYSFCYESAPTRLQFRAFHHITFFCCRPAAVRMHEGRLSCFWPREKLCAKFRSFLHTQ